MLFNEQIHYVNCAITPRQNCILIPFLSFSLRRPLQTEWQAARFTLGLNSLLKYRIHPAAMCVFVCVYEWENLTTGLKSAKFPFASLELDSLILLSVRVVPSPSKVEDLRATEHENEIFLFFFFFGCLITCEKQRRQKEITRSNSSVTKPLKTVWTKQHIFNSDLVFSLVFRNFYYVTFQISMRLQWFLNCNAHLMLKMFTEAIVLLNQCASIWIFMVYFKGSFPLFCILYYSLFVLSFRRLCTGIINFCSPHKWHKYIVWFHWFLCIMHRAQCVSLAVCQRGSTVFYHPGARWHVSPQTSLCHASLIYVLSVCTRGITVFSWKSFFPLNKIRSNLQCGAVLYSCNNLFSDTNINFVK